MRLAKFLQPTRHKVACMVPWLVYAVFAILQAGFEVKPLALNLLWPLVFFYLVGCVLAGLDRPGWKPLSTLGAYGVSGGLVAVDQVLKWLVVRNLALGEVIPLIPHRLHLGHFQNTHGSWVAAVQGASPVVGKVLIFSLVFLILIPLMYRFYAVEQRRSFWSQSAFICLMAGMAGAAVDLGFRGLVIDYLLIPGHFAVDMKDIFLMIGEASALVEALDNPRITLRWRGWRQEFRDGQDLLVRFARFTVRELGGRRGHGN